MEEHKTSCSPRDYYQARWHRKVYSCPRAHTRLLRVGSIGLMDTSTPCAFEYKRMNNTL